MIPITEIYDGIETVEFIVRDNTAGRYFFPDIPILRDKIIRRIDFNNLVYYEASGAQRIHYELFSFMYISLYTGNSEILKYPVSSLSAQEFWQKEVDILNQTINWGKSFVDIIPGGTPSATRGFSFTIYWQHANKPRLNYSLPPNIKTDYVEAIISDVTDPIVRITNFRNLINKKVWQIICFIPYQETFYSPDGREIVGQSIIIKSFLNLYDKSEKIVNDFTLSKTNINQSASNLVLLRGLVIDWDKSYIKVSELTGLVAGTVFYLPVYYTD